MRERADAERIRSFMRSAGAAAAREGVCYLTGGATAVLVGWRATTIDVDVALEPEQDELLRALPQIKQELDINVELASPGDFIPLPSEWRERSIGVAQEGSLSFAHFDPYSQALSKLERGHRHDLEDVEELMRREPSSSRGDSASSMRRSSPSSTASPRSTRPPSGPPLSQHRRCPDRIGRFR